MTRGAAFDVQAVCSGFVYRAGRRRQLHRVGQARTGAGDRRRDLLAHPRLDRPRHLRAVRRRRRRGGAAAREGDGRQSDHGVLSTHLHSDGRYHDVLYVDGGPSSTQTTGHLRMDGREVFRHAVVNLAEAVDAAHCRQRRHRRRRRLAGAAPGQPAHHRRHGPQARPAAGAGRRHRRPARQHLGRLDPAGAGRGGRTTGASSAGHWC